MRSELTTLEQIDLYLTGKLPPGEQALFESKIAVDPALENAVNQQKDLVRAVNRKALRTQINSVAAGGAAGSGFGNLFLGIGGVLVAGLITTGIVYYSFSDEVESEDLVIVQTEPKNSPVNAISLEDYEMVEDNLLKEEPETIFSSIITYDEEEDENDQMSVTVNFVHSGERRSTENNGGAIISEEGSDRSRIVVEEIDKSEIQNLSSRALYSGGNLEMRKFIDRNLSYPKSAKDKGIEGVVRCEFLVTEDGLISQIDAKCIKMSENNGEAFSDMRLFMNKKIMNAFINNATHILRTMPNWEPAKDSQGNPMLSAQRMYFNYDMERGCLVYQLDDDIPVK